MWFWCPLRWRLSYCLCNIVYFMTGSTISKRLGLAALLYIFTKGDSVSHLLNEWIYYDGVCTSALASPESTNCCYIGIFFLSKLTSPKLILFGLTWPPPPPQTHTLPPPLHLSTSVLTADRSSPSLPSIESTWNTSCWACAREVWGKPGPESFGEEVWWIPGHQEVWWLPWPREVWW